MEFSELTPESSKRLELIAQTASLYRPAQLEGKIRLLLNALLFQHEVVIAELAGRVDQSEILAVFHSFSQDSRAIELMLRILGTVDADFERGSAETSGQVLDIAKDNAIDFDLSTKKQQLENLLNDN